MRKKIIGIFLMILLITTAISVTGFIKDKNQYEKYLFETHKVIVKKIFNDESSINKDQLDQYYTQHSYSRNIGNSTGKLAQTFKPIYPTITRLEILLEKKSGNTNFNYYILRLNSGAPGGTVVQIYETTFESGIISTGTYWYEFDIIDQSVLPGATYHIEIYGIIPTIYTTNLEWRYGFEETYTKGDAYQYFNSEWNILQVAGTPCDFCFKTYGTDFGGNHPPNIPNIPSGPSTGTIGIQYHYTTSSTDSDGDQIKYGFDFDGDGTVNNWSEFENSGDSCLIFHKWNNKGTYQVKVKAQDEHGRESGWSDPLSVTIPKIKTKTKNISFLTFLENHPYLFPLIRHSLELFLSSLH